MSSVSGRGEPSRRPIPRIRVGGREPEHVAAVDLGSNSFHMIVARPAAGEVQVLDRLREMIRLASGLDEKRHLSTDAQERALACLERFGQRVRHLPSRAVRAVGTNTLRSGYRLDFD